MANVMISFPGDPAVIFFSFVPIRLRISFSLFLLLPAILHGTLAKHNSIFSQSFSDIFGGYYFLFPKRSQSVSEKSFPQSASPTLRYILPSFGCRSPLRRPHSDKISHKLGLAAHEKPFSDTLYSGHAGSGTGRKKTGG